MLTSGAAVGLPQIGSAAESATVPAKRSYSYHGRPDDYTEFRVIEPGRVIQKIETFNQGIVQPDVLYLGGITRAWRVGLLAGLAGKTVVPHSANHSMVTLFTLHLFAAMPNAGAMMEWSIEHDGINKQATEFLNPNPFVKDGRAHFEAGPGWGVKISPQWLKAATYQKSERKA